MSESERAAIMEVHQKIADSCRCAQGGCRVYLEQQTKRLAELLGFTVTSTVTTPAADRG